MLNKVNKDIIILGIETSCDDTSIAISKNNNILSNIVANQTVHKEYGGVVPELASREHQKNIVPTLFIAIEKSNIKLHDIDAIAFTRGPGLMGSLLIGTSFAKSISLALNKPLIEVNHMEAHVLANFIDQKPHFPFLCLTVSGGHTQIVIVQDIDSIEILGETLDDSAGETFDKCAKLLGLSYPGGPEIEKKAKDGNKNAFKFTIPKVKDLNFSFSGLKTNIKLFLDKESKKNKDFIQENKSDLCASIQHTIIKILIQKLEAAITKYKITDIAISGGVAANQKFRNAIKLLKEKYNASIYVPKKEYSTDNGAMIAVSGYYKYKSRNFTDLSVNIQPRYKLEKYLDN